ncbi:uncharacterized protein [Desmodus rotundus]|uniref:uncharacterized protein n=1 Tax=Desmodus rotundus TaxID=9430 RepID=UPI002380FD08|nr:uncharacterized protein LOC128781456 [Desmodus rotundus]
MRLLFWSWILGTQRTGTGGPGSRHAVDLPRVPGGRSRGPKPQLSSRAKCRGRTVFLRGLRVCLLCGRSQHLEATCILWLGVPSSISGGGNLGLSPAYMLSSHSTDPRDDTETLGNQSISPLCVTQAGDFVSGFARGSVPSPECHFAGWAGGWCFCSLSFPVPRFLLRCRSPVHLNHRHGNIFLLDLHVGASSVGEPVPVVPSPATALWCPCPKSSVPKGLASLLALGHQPGSQRGVGKTPGRRAGALGSRPGGLLPHAGPGVAEQGPPWLLPEPGRSASHHLPYVASLGMDPATHGNHSATILHHPGAAQPPFPLQVGRWRRRQVAHAFIPLDKRSCVPALRQNGSAQTHGLPRHGQACTFRTTRWPERCPPGSSPWSPHLQVRAPALPGCPPVGAQQPLSVRYSS